MIGRVRFDGAQQASHCAPSDCVHWGVRQWVVGLGEQYVDPLTLMGRPRTEGPVVLLL